ncbi:MAG: M16 family metallopeptidase, partial [Candidatus Krumholzibacteriia bacterium]
MENRSYREETPPSREILPGGAILLSAPLAGAQSVALGLWVRRGTEDEPAGLGGVSHFLEHIVFKGSDRYSALDLARGFDALGASVDAFTTKDHIAFTLRVLPEYLAAAAELMADMTLRPAFDPEMIALEQEVVCEEIQEARDTPEDWLHDAFAARVYGAHPRGLPILGTRESVTGLRAGLLRRQHAAIFAGPNLVLSLSGPDHPRLVEAVTAAFGPRLWGAAAAGAPEAPA